ncbi:hypothetical protein WA026_005659 [Henosepilachna vigintioctopunctata]|uniref:Serpin domain-containing protein n=1 Tax=Henosepilachna vigintioctopunctata TaxID=420089 RepID=A0AAW1U1L2_9CUCU
MTSRKQISDKPNFWIELGSKNKMALLNNAHVDARWLQGFDRQSTEEMDFHVSSTETVKANMMKVTGYFMISRHHDLGVNMIKLPFKNERGYLLIVLTDDLKPANYISENALKIWTGRTYTREYITLYFPKFELSSALDLIPTLRKMGIVNLFSKADLSGISEEIDNVSMMYQKIQININEQGVSANNSSIAVDNAIIKQSDNKEEPKVFRVDHPFVFGILYDDLSLIFGHIFRL